MLRAVRACPSCGRSNADDARFCSSCGSALERGCARCGAELAADARFCSSCGAPVGAPESPAPPAGQERRLVTILFADVTGSTGLGERLDPEQLQALLATYFAAMRAEIEAEGGTVEKFIGDAVMAAFGVPVAHEDDPIRAVRAALRMQRRLPDLNDELVERFGVRIEIRVGVNTGEVLAEIEAAPGDALVTGDAVNVAARLEQMAAPGEIVAAERTSRAARGFAYRSLGATEIRGRDAPVPAVVVLGEASDRSERGIPGLRAPIVGRDRELDLLRSVLERTTAERRPNLVTIYGDPGVGKSRLTQEFVSASSGGDAAPLVLRGRCLPYGDGVTYWPLAEILKSWAGVFDDDAPATAREKIADAAEPVLTAEFHPEPRRAVAALAFTVGVDDPELGFEDLDPRRVREETHAAWRSFFSALAASRPVIIVVEDIHWADPALLDLLEELAERVVGPVLFLCPSRPELVESRPGWGGGRRNVSSIALEPLSAADADRLIELLLAVDDLPPALRDRILARAEGNPFFLEEIVRHLIDERRIERIGDRWHAAPGIADVEVPDTVQAVLAARIDLLEPADKRTLQRAAVVGRVFWPGPVRRLLNGDADALGGALERFEERDLVLPRLGSAFVGEPEFIFKHVLTAQVAYDSLPRRDRADAHTEVARWLEETAGERREEFVELLAHHHVAAYRAAKEQTTDERSLADLRRRAFDATYAAAEAMRRKVAFAKARRLAREAIELAPTPVDRAAALGSVGRTCTADYRGDDAYAAFRTAVDLLVDAAPDDERIPIFAALAVDVPTRWPGIMVTVPPLEEVEPYLDIGLAHATEDDSEARVRLLTAKAFLPFATFGEGYDDSTLDEHRAGAEEAADMALRLGRHDLASGALDAVGALFQMAGRHAEMLERDARRLALEDRIDDPGEIADMVSAAAQARLAVGRFREALELADHGVDVGMLSAPSYGGYSLAWSVVAAFCLGEWDDALARFGKLQRFLGGREPTRPWLQAFAIAAFVHDARGNTVEADRLLERVRTGSPTQRYRTVTGPSWLSRILARRGRHAEAREWAEKMTLRESNVLSAEARCEQVAEEHAWERVDEVVAYAAAATERSGSILATAYPARLQGRSALAAGDVATTVERFTTARDVFASCDAGWEAACTELALAEALADDDVDGAVAAVRRAAPSLTAAGAVRELSAARNLDARLGANAFGSA
jgi:class 3 adenylate cyclase/tetratricopeptide (TPR) repeat protein